MLAPILPAVVNVSGEPPAVIQIRGSRWIGGGYILMGTGGSSLIIRGGYSVTGSCCLPRGLGSSR